MSVGGLSLNLATVRKQFSFAQAVDACVAHGIGAIVLRFGFERLHLFSGERRLGGPAGGALEGSDRIDGPDAGDIRLAVHGARLGVVLAGADQPGGNEQNRRKMKQWPHDQLCYISLYGC